MAHNFKRTGVYYVAKSPAGHNSNNATTPDTPRATLRISDTNTHIIGAGVYANQSFSPGSNDYFRYTADGKVIFLNITLGAGGGPVLNLIDCDNCSFTSVSSRGLTVQNGIYKNTAVFHDGQTGGGTTINKIVFIDCGEKTIGFTGSAGTLRNFNNCIIINCQNVTGTVSGQTNGTFHNNYIDINSIITFVTQQSRIRNCNIQGQIRFPSSLFSDATQRFYAIQDQLTGTPQDNDYPAGVNWLTEAQLTADGYTGGVSGWNAMVNSCINRDPEFNNPEVNDFTLKANSPMIAMAVGGITNIGGTEVAISVINTDDNGDNTDVIPSAEIDTTVPLSYQLEDEEDEGFIDYIFKRTSDTITLGIVRPLAELKFDSSQTPGTALNNNVPDSEPLTAEYPRKLTTTSAASDAVTLKVTAHDAVVGEFVRVAGEDREITDIPDADTITVGAAFRANVGSGVTFQIGTEEQLGALRPNRLTYLLRTSTNSTKPVVDADWDNGIDPIYEAEGLFLTQEWNTVPGYIIDNLDDNKVYGKGDSEAPTDIEASDMEGIWFNIRVYLRNDYAS
jgi:hypothetical protein